jgi:hypothetical protein
MNTSAMPSSLELGQNLLKLPQVVKHKTGYFQKIVKKAARMVG